VFVENTLDVGLIPAPTIAASQMQARSAMQGLSMHSVKQVQHVPASASETLYTSFKWYHDITCHVSGTNKPVKPSWDNVACWLEFTNVTRLVAELRHNQSLSTIGHCQPPGR
jgi:hypothetical protein